MLVYSLQSTAFTSILRLAAFTIAIQLVIAVPAQAQSSLQSPSANADVIYAVEEEQISSAAAYAEVVFAKGDVTFSLVTDKDDRIKISKGDKLYRDSLIQTGENGFVSLRFSTGSYINIQPASRVKLRISECTDSDEVCIIVVGTESGEPLNNWVKDEGSPIRFTIDTPYHRAAVRGPSFHIDEEVLKRLSDRRN